MANLSKPRRTALALGGFLMFLGFVLVGIFVMVLFDIVHLEALVDSGHRMIFLGMLLVVAILDLVSAFILAR